MIKRINKKIFSGFVALSLLFFSVSKTEAAVVEKVLPYFGGPIYWTMPCTCSPAHYFMVYDYKSFTFTLQHLAYGVSRFNMSFNIYEPLIQTVGDFIIGPQLCWMTVGTGCVLFEAEGLISPPPRAGIGTGGVPDPGAIIP